MLFRSSKFFYSRCQLLFSGNLRNMSGTCTATASSEQKIKVNDVLINYVKSGQGQRAVLLMPGALGSAWTDFRPQIDTLSVRLPNYTIIAWDPPGYGKSIPPTRKFTVDFFERDAHYAQGLMRELGYSSGGDEGKKYSIMGWSDGGITGLALAAAFPEVVDKLVIWGSNSYVMPEEIEIYQGIRDVNKWSPKMRAPMEQLYGPEGFAKMWEDWVDIFVKIGETNNGTIVPTQDLAKIKAPTLIVHGVKDAMISGEHIPFLRKHIKHTEYYEFKDGKHNIHLRYPDEFNKVVAGFLMK